MVPIAWAPRAEPLRPLAAAAVGPAAVALARKLVGLAPERLAELQGVAGRDCLVICGPEEGLPWVDGIAYLGRDAAAPALLLPTTVAPTLAADLLEAAVLRMAIASPPFAVLASARRIVPLGDLRPIAIERVRAWLEAAV